MFAAALGVMTTFLHVHRKWRQNLIDAGELPGIITAEAEIFAIRRAWYAVLVKIGSLHSK
jgi:hypothetical protein